MVDVKTKAMSIFTAVLAMIILVAGQSVSAVSTDAQIFLKGCRNGEVVRFYVDSPDGGNRQEVTAESNIYGGGRAFETVVSIPEGYTSTDVLIAECSKVTLATLIAPSTVFCGAQDGLGIYQDFESQGNKLCFKVRTIL